MGLFSFFSKGGNYGLIARNVTAFHETLRITHRKRFPDYRSLLIFTGLMDVAAYTAQGQISPHDIVEAADQSLAGTNSWPTDKKSIMNVLLKFVMRIEIMIFIADNPGDRNVINGVNSRINEIGDGVLEVLNEYAAGRTSTMANLAAKQWLSNPQMAELRKSLGIL